jgi:peroxiredoxin
MAEDPEALVARLTGLPAPTAVLPWTTYADSHELLGPAANTTLATLANRKTLIVYFFPSETEGNPEADTMGNIFRDHDHIIHQLQVLTVGVSTQTALAQQELAVGELFPQMLLADDKLKLADSLQLPTIEINGRDEYEPMTLVIHEGHIAHVFYPIPSAKGHIAGVLAFLALTTTDPVEPKGHKYGTHKELSEASPTLIAELALRPNAQWAIESAGIEKIGQLPHTADALLRIPGITGQALHEIIYALGKHGMTLPSAQLGRTRPLPDDRDLKMLHLRAVEGRTFDDIAFDVGLSKERVRQRLQRVFGLSTPPRRPSPTRRRGRGAGRAGR